MTQPPAWALDRAERKGGSCEPGYDAHEQRLVDAAQAAMNLLVDTLSDPGGRTLTRPSRALTSQLSVWAQERGLDIDPAIALRTVRTWSRLHGFVSLEIAGNFGSMGIDPDAVFEMELSKLAA